MLPPDQFGGARTVIADGIEGFDKALDELGLHLFFNTRSTSRTFIKSKSRKRHSLVTRDDLDKLKYWTDGDFHTLRVQISRQFFFLKGENTVPLCSASTTLKAS